MNRRKWLDRREFLGNMGSGLGSIALACMMQESSQASTSGSPLAPRPPMFPAKAKRVIQIFCPGAVSQLDTFDYKPELIRMDDKPMPSGPLITFQGGNGNLMKSPYNWSQKGKCGKWVTDMLPQIGECVDDIAFVHSLTARSNTHGPGLLQMNTGFVFDGFPSIGAWVTYALGSVNQDLPAFVVIPDMRGMPPNGPSNWMSGFLPAAYQGTAFNTVQPIADLRPPAGSSSKEEADLKAFLERLNSDYDAHNPGYTDLNARVSSYELAARMQLSAPEVTDISKESPETLKMYGADDPNPLKAGYAKNTILARRLLERGVRFVELYCGSRASGVDGLLNWDAHRTLKADYDRHGPILDQPTAALLKDLKQRGLLEDTLVLWTTEFGRMPTHQSGTVGRDHNPAGFTCWMAGAGVKGGTSYGETDDFGYKAVKDVATVYDFHATVLHLLGLDHKKLTFYHDGVNRRLTDVYGDVITPILV